MMTRRIGSAAVAALAATAACQPPAGTGMTASPAEAAVGERIEVTMIDTTGAPVGVARLTPVADGVQISFAGAGLPPGTHGFHIHETARCDPAGFQSAGGHYAPMGNPHGFEVAGGPHAGDMRNIEVGADGQVRVEVTNERVTLGEGPATLFDDDGSALMIHAGADDYRSQPSGDAGARIACGVIARP